MFDLYAYLKLLKKKKFFYKVVIKRTQIEIKVIPLATIWDPLNLQLTYW